MDLQNLFNILIILAGAIVMIGSLFISRRYAGLVTLIRREDQHTMRLFFTLHRALMVVFLMGYLGAIAAILMQFPLLSETFVSFIFLFGSVFVYMSVAGMLRLTASIPGNPTADKK
ncbi:MAG: hypothetical protein ACFHX7_17275 [Pseudomonadota bacterium]